MTKLRLRSKVNFPALVTASSPLVLSKNNGIYKFSLDADALSDVLGALVTASSPLVLSKNNGIYEFSLDADALSDVLGSNLAPIENPIVRGSLTVTKTVAGSLSSDFTVETVNATSGETHSSTFRSQDDNAGTVRSLFTAAGPLNAGNKTQGNFDLLVEDGTIFMSRTTSQVASGGTSMTLHDRVGSGAAKITLSTFGDSAFAGGGLNVSGGAIKSSHATAGVGYATGAGGAVTQATSKSTGVTLNRATGKITTNNAALNAGASVSFTLTDSAIAATDGIGVQIVSGATAGAYSVTVDAVASGSCQISLRNLTGGNLSEAVVLRFWKINSIDS